MNAGLARKRWLWALMAAVAAICTVTATIWIVRGPANPAASQEDCAIVGRIAREWMTTMAIDKVAVGPDKPADASSVSRWTAMSEKSRAAADSVSAPALKDDLDKWAEGFSLFAQLRSDPTGDKQPFQVGGAPDELEIAYKAMDLVSGTVDDLSKACPSDWPVQPVN